MTITKEDEVYKPAPQEFFIPRFPPDQPLNLCNDEYPGPLNFEVYVIPNEQKTPWEYSPTLNKIFIDINVQFVIAFGVKSPPGDLDLFVRATPIFSQSQFFQEPVHRCIGHRHNQDPSNIGVPEHVHQHIMRCTNKNTSYFGDINDGTRLNLVLPLGSPQTGTDTVKEFLYFVCKNSCPSGMNRRPIEVVFSLENQNGQVLGRRVIAVRICSCPKRDREKEEGSQAPQGKKRKLEDGDGIDTKIFPVKLNIVGKKNCQLLLQYCYNLMAGQIVKLEGQNDAPFRKCLREISALMNE